MLKIVQLVNITCLCNKLRIPSEALIRLVIQFIVRYVNALDFKFQRMYKVFIESVCIYQSPQIDDAVAFALGLHRSSNVPHNVGVIEVGSLKPSISFVRPRLDEDKLSSDVRS